MLMGILRGSTGSVYTCFYDCCVQVCVGLSNIKQAEHESA